MGTPLTPSLSRYGYSVTIGSTTVDGRVRERGLVTTNGIESFWALLKRGYVGTFHWMSWKHLHRYVEEFAYRHNSGKGNGFATIGAVVDCMVGKRLTYKRLIA